ncbi:MAG: hypothetical protein V1849_02180 [Chloroflexota bacterium]
MNKEILDFDNWCQVSWGTIVRSHQELFACGIPQIRNHVDFEKTSLPLKAHIAEKLILESCSRIGSFCESGDVTWYICNFGRELQDDGTVFTGRRIQPLKSALLLLAHLKFSGALPLKSNNFDHILAPTSVSPHRNELVVTVGRPAAGMVVDPSGSSTGYLTDGSLVNQIAGSKASVIGESNQVIRISEPGAGTYSIVLRGTDDRTSNFSIEALAEGKRVFRYASSWKITAEREFTISLQVNVLDGLLQGVSLVHPEPPGSQVKADAAQAKTRAEEKERVAEEGGPLDLYRLKKLRPLSRLKLIPYCNDFRIIHNHSPNSAQPEHVLYY